MSQVLDEGCESSSSGVEYAVAVQRAEEPLQTGQYQQTRQENCFQEQRNHVFLAPTTMCF